MYERVEYRVRNLVPIQGGAVAQIPHGPADAFRRQVPTLAVACHRVKDTVHRGHVVGLVDRRLGPVARLVLRLGVLISRCLQRPHLLGPKWQETQ